ncbi:MAG: PhzF family phenazine biosynthesis protein [Balneolaceae bacterium]
MKNVIETYIVDSFTDEPFKGNPAGVCILQHELDEEKKRIHGSGTYWREQIYNQKYGKNRSGGKIEGLIMKKQLLVHFLD